MKVELVDRASGARFTGASFDEVLIGSADECDIVLPRAHYVDLGRKELQLVQTPAGFTLRTLQRTSDTRLAGTRIIDETALLAGAHELSVNGHIFTLTVGR